MDTTPNLTIMVSTSRHLFDPVFFLEVHQPVALATESLCVVVVSFLSQVLADEIEHGG